MKQEPSARSRPRIAVSLAIAASVLVYLAATVVGKLPKERRLGAGELSLSALGLLVSYLLMNPGVLDRLTSLEVGGAKIGLEAVKQRQEEQESELANIRLILPLLLPEPERAHLRNLMTTGGPDYIGGNMLRTEIRHLRSMGLIERVDNHGVSELTDGRSFRLADYVRLTDAGKEWLLRLPALEKKT